ncbi:DoxX family protein [Janthinobacterium fluminis]|uniref:DoxX family protein n=1 Tax=Janthinobacterium fluminis TaxID=2987524 RepID=A0ABT5JYQ8_9BURK|nr:DoxX family protein [Janthinobacterium fluminis]MDC8757868.1 DoxX family protein [Janthinobacterium fluminis]
MKNFPFISFPHAMLLLRIAIAIMFMAHAGVRIANGTIPRFAGFMNDKGFVFGLAIVWAITAFELLGGALLIMGKARKWVAAGFMAISGGGIVLIHAAQGWFVGEHGTGGVEYSVVLFVACVVIAAADTRPAQPALAS